MIKPQQLSLLFLALILEATPLLAQSEDAELPSTEDTSAGDQSQTASQTSSTKEAAQKSTPAKTGQDSPFEYRPSEEISEDVPVSFPVDI
jgi:hypothetical protein